MRKPYFEVEGKEQTIFRLMGGRKGEGELEVEKPGVCLPGHARGGAPSQTGREEIRAYVKTDVSRYGPEDLCDGNFLWKIGDQVFFEGRGKGASESQKRSGGERVLLGMGDETQLL